jgi:cysteine synthase
VLFTMCFSFLGNTPLLRINCLSDSTGVEIWAKCEVRMIGFLTSYINNVNKFIFSIADNNNHLKNSLEKKNKHRQVS